jgi:Ca2+-binding RTX toxin-like protein
MDFTDGDKLNLHNLAFYGFGAGTGQLSLSYNGTHTFVTANTAINGTTFQVALAGDVQSLMINANLVYTANSMGGAGADTITLIGSGHMGAHGGDGNDSLVGSTTTDASSYLYGGAGDDTLTSGSNNYTADVLTGGSGSDYFKFTSTASSNTITSDTIMDFSNGDKLNLHNLAFDGFGTDAGQLSYTYDSTYTIVTANTTASGYIFQVALAGDVRSLMTNANLVYTATNNGSTFAETLTGQFVFGDAGDDTITGAGSSILYGGDGNDSITGTNGNDELSGGAGDDTINLLQGNDRAFGGSGNDSINAGTGSNQMYGGSGNDSIDAGGGNDSIFGGAGADSLWGGLGNDMFVYTNNTDSGIGVGNWDVINDFATGDTIDLQQFTGMAEFRTGGNGELNFTGGVFQVAYQTSGGNTTVFVDENGDNTVDFQIQLLGITSLSSSDFAL